MKLECLENRTLLACVDPQCMDVENPSKTTAGTGNEIGECDLVYANPGRQDVSWWVRTVCLVAHAQSSGILIF